MRGILCHLHHQATDPKALPLVIQAIHSDLECPILALICPKIVQGLILIRDAPTMFDNADAARAQAEVDLEARVQVIHARGGAPWRGMNPVGEDGWVLPERTMNERDLGRIPRPLSLKIDEPLRIQARVERKQDLRSRKRWVKNPEV